jgi:hypothetical protein
VVDTCTCTGEGLECLVWVRVVLAAKDSLDCLSYNSPVSLKVSAKSILIEDKFAKTLLE